MPEDQVTAGDGTVIRRPDTAELAELRVLLEVAARIGTDPPWHTFTLAAALAVPALLSALPTLYDPSDREETAYVAGREAVLDELDSWLSQPRPDGGLERGVRQWIRDHRV